MSTMTPRQVNTVEPPERDPLPKNKLYKDGIIQLEALRTFLFREGRLALEDAFDIVDKATALLKEEPNLLQVKSPITICGDTHGQYYDLMKLLEVGGKPEDTNYLFLGDYVDRGNFSCEVVLLLYAYKIVYPTKVFMLRGNHECRHLTEYFTFKEECRVKYNLELYDRICTSFDALPLAAVMNKQFLCVHGGLSPDIQTLDDIMQIDRFQEPPVVGPMCDLLWADPLENYDDAPNAGFYFNEARGCSYAFGYKAVVDFLTNNKLLCLIRAHEAQDNGFKMYRKNPKNKFPTVITLFSAPNYLDAYGNKGAVMHYEKTYMNIRQFQCSDHPYWLPNFMDVITWSMPFVAEKVSDVLLSCLKLVDDSPPKEGDAVDQAALRKKILLVGKLSRMYGVLKDERDAVMQLKGLTDGKRLPPGILQSGGDGIRQCIGDFTKAKEADARNERMPPTPQRTARPPTASS